MVAICRVFDASEEELFGPDSLLRRQLVIDTGPGIPGGYTDRGTPDTDTDTDFCIRRHTRTPTRHTHTHDGGYVS